MKIKTLLLTAIALFASTGMSFAQRNTNPSFTRGVAGQVEAGALFHEGFAGEYVNVSSGYNVLPGLYAGVGVGIKNQRFNTPSPSEKSFFVPTFIQLRYSFLNRTLSPYIDLKGGLVSDFSSSVRTSPWPDHLPSHGCGHFFRVGFGVDYKRYSLYLGEDWAQVRYYNSTASSDYAWVIGVTYRF